MPQTPRKPQRLPTVMATPSPKKPEDEEDGDGGGIKARFRLRNRDLAWPYMTPRWNEPEDAKTAAPPEDLVADALLAEFPPRLLSEDSGGAVPQVGGPPGPSPFLAPKPHTAAAAARPRVWERPSSPSMPRKEVLEERRADEEAGPAEKDESRDVRLPLKHRIVPPRNPRKGAAPPKAWRMSGSKEPSRYSITVGQPRVEEPVGNPSDMGARIRDMAAGGRPSGMSVAASDAPSLLSPSEYDLMHHPPPQMTGRRSSRRRESVDSTHSRRLGGPEEGLGDHPMEVRRQDSISSQISNQTEVTVMSLRSSSSFRTHVHNLKMKVKRRDYHMARNSSEVNLVIDIPKKSLAPDLKDMVRTMFKVFTQEDGREILRQEEVRAFSELMGYEMAQWFTDDDLSVLWSVEDVNKENELELEKIYNVFGELFSLGALRRRLKEFAPTLDVANGKYTGPTRLGKPHGIGSMVFDDGTLYEGDFVDGIINGSGYAQYPDGKMYEGDFKDGKAQGRGFAKFASGAEYEGQWQDDRPWGIGTCLFACGDLFDGLWNHGLMHGRGTYVAASGDAYVGEWEKGVAMKISTMSTGNERVVLVLPRLTHRYKNFSFKSKRELEEMDRQRSLRAAAGVSSHGKAAGREVSMEAAMRWAGHDAAENGGGRAGEGLAAGGAPRAGRSGSLANKIAKEMSKGVAPSRDIAVPGEYVYFGDTWLMEPHGQGMFTTPDGGMYTGFFVNGFPHGKGQYQYTNGDVYEGSYMMGRRTGLGTYHFTSGTRYVGNHLDGQPHGPGTMFYADGTKYTGQFDMGAAHGSGRRTYSSGGEYVGEWREDKRSGTGEFTLPNGVSYEGEWKDDRPHGYGVRRYLRGEVYKGQWERGVRSGHGVLSWPNKSVTEGPWKDDHQVGVHIFTSTTRKTFKQVWKNRQIQQQRAIEGLLMLPKLRQWTRDMCGPMIT